MNDNCGSLCHPSSSYTCPWFLPELRRFVLSTNLRSTGRINETRARSLAAEQHGKPVKEMTAARKIDVLPPPTIMELAPLDSVVLRLDAAASTSLRTQKSDDDTVVRAIPVIQLMAAAGAATAAAPHSSRWWSTDVLAKKPRRHAKLGARHGPGTTLPRWAPTYNMTMSSASMVCNITQQFDPAVAAGFGIADFDWSNQKAQWAISKPMDCEERMVSQAQAVKALNKDTHVMVYRNRE